MSEVLARLVRSPQGAIGLGIVSLVGIAVVAGPWLAPHDPNAISILARYKPPGGQYLLGTDQLGRDLLSRLLHGAQSTVIMAAIATLCGTVMGALIGTTSAYVGGRTDDAVMRTIDAVMAIPSLLMSLLVVSMLGRSQANAVLAIAIAFTPGMARITRSVALAVRKQDYVSAAIARGEGTAYIVMGEMVPNVVAPIIVEMTIRVAFSVMLFATLSFLGLGAQPPTPEWGLMVSEARKFMHLSTWMILWPCCAIALVAIGFNLLGDGLRDALNPRT
ncbi:MAG: ABC transporter permease [Alphaproteobacteria bacterium]|nr:ABC transporter permease [Alphaproteobacteria bacterium]